MSRAKSKSKKPRTIISKSILDAIYEKHLAKYGGEGFVDDGPSFDDPPYEKDYKAGKLTEGQYDALKLMDSGKNVFLTGGAGTGKSFVIEYFMKTQNNCLTSAPTGLAALHIGGKTLHSLFGLSVGINHVSMLNGKYGDECLFETEYDYQKYMRHLGPERAELLRCCDVLVIDEISMVRADVFEFIYCFLCAEEDYNDHHIQLIVCGDFCQLPPVISREDKQFWNTLYADNLRGYAFLSPVWPECKFHICNLTQVIRQENQDFAGALNKIRMGDANGEGIEWINAHSVRGETKEAITLCPLRKEAETINMRELDALPGNVLVAQMRFDGDATIKELSADRLLHLKVGARVVFLVNDNVNDFYRNGTLGTVTAINVTDGEISSIGVLIDGEKEPTDVKTVTWKIKRPTVEEKNGHKRIKYETVCEYTQFPLRLAWACTIHKSQGQTYSASNLRLTRIWDPGQAYVALSRVGDVKNLYMDKDLSPDAIHVNYYVADFYSWIDSPECVPPDPEDDETYLSQF